MPASIGVSGGLDFDAGAAGGLQDVRRPGTASLRYPGVHHAGLRYDAADARQRCAADGATRGDVARGRYSGDLPGGDAALSHRPFGIDLKGLDVEGFQRALFEVPQDKHEDLVFENVQARMRTSILMNSGFVIGTGDVSELALGWCTYNGDHMSMYNPNVSIPKTLVKFLVGWAACRGVRGRRGQRCSSIVGTRISPELLPVGKDGEITPGNGGFRWGRTSCTTSSCSTSCATERRRRRYCFWRRQAGFGKVYAPEALRRRLQCSCAVLRQSVQAFVSAGWAEGGVGEFVAARRLAHAVGRPGMPAAVLAGAAQRLTGSPRAAVGQARMPAPACFQRLPDEGRKLTCCSVSARKTTRLLLTTGRPSRRDCTRRS